MIYFTAIIRRFSLQLLLSLLALVGVYLLFDCIESVRLLLAYDAPFSTLWQLIGARVPTAIYQLLPLACLLAVLSLWMELARDGELLLLCASGQNRARRWLPFLAVAFFAALLQFGWGERVVPQAERQARYVMDHQIKHSRGRTSSTRMDRKWFVGPSGIWRIDSRDGQRLVGVELYEMDDQGSSQAHWSAQTMEWERNGWKMDSPQLEWLVSVSEAERAKAVLREFQETQDHFTVLWDAAETMTLSKLRQAISLKRKQGMDGLTYQTAFWLRMSYPFLSFGLVLLALALGERRADLVNRSRARLMTVALAAVLGVLFFLIVSIGKQGAEAGLWSAVFGALLAPLLAWIAALGLAVRYRL